MNGLAVSRLILQMTSLLAGTAKSFSLISYQPVLVKPLKKRVRLLMSLIAITDC